jgi:hypothetical protein
VHSQVVGRIALFNAAMFKMSVSASPSKPTRLTSLASSQEKPDFKRRATTLSAVGESLNRPIAVFAIIPRLSPCISWSASSSTVQEAKSKQRQKERDHCRGTPMRPERHADQLENSRLRRASASAPSDSPKSRNAMSKKPGIKSKLMMIPHNHAATR